MKEIQKHSIKLLKEWKNSYKSDHSGVGGEHKSLRCHSNRNVKIKCFPRHFG